MMFKWLCTLSLCVGISVGMQAQTSCLRPSPVDVFTPNGDGVNDKWEILCLIDFPNNSVSIYNRWGVVVYQATGYDQNWDGTNATDNKPLDEGTYVYVLNYMSQQEKQQVTGTITIIR